MLVADILKCYTLYRTLVEDAYVLLFFHLLIEKGYRLPRFLDKMSLISKDDWIITDDAYKGNSESSTAAQFHYNHLRYSFPYIMSALLITVTRHERF